VGGAVPLDRVPPRQGLGEVGLVGHDDLRALGERRRVRRELLVDDAEVVQGIAPRLRIEVEHVEEEPCPLGVPEELVTEAPALRRARDEAGQVGDHKRALVVHADDAERRRERRERVVRDPGLGR